MRARAYCAHHSVRDHLVLRGMSKGLDQVFSLKQYSQGFKAPKQVWYSFIDPLQEGCKVELTFARRRIEPRTCGVEARCATTRPLGLQHPKQYCVENFGSKELYKCGEKNLLKF
ncbi:hypothetical protein TNCV_2074591 [Trichonephila clavipes]|nr:hypothetical protein TNCV_2074591 [Trichonephila clavipes]